MGTRLLSELLVKKRFPHLTYIRIYTPEKHKATIYAWNEDLSLPEKDALSLQHYASGYLYPYVAYQVKPYHLVQQDKVPIPQEIPEAVMQAAKRRTLNQYGILDTMNRLFPYGLLSFVKYDAAEGLIHFDFDATRRLQDREKEVMYQYLYEMIPLGSYCEITFH